MSVAASVVSWPKGSPMTWISQIPVRCSRYNKTAPRIVHCGSLTPANLSYCQICFLFMDALKLGFHQKWQCFTPSSMYCREIYGLKISIGNLIADPIYLQTCIVLQSVHLGMYKLMLLTKCTSTGNPFVFYQQRRLFCE